MTSSIIDNCGICRDELVSSLTTLECNHAFHTECIDTWTERVNECPFCHNPIIIDGMKKILKDARLGLFENMADLVYAIYCFECEITYDDFMPLILEGHISKNGIIELIQSSYIRDDDIILSIIDNNYLDGLDIQSLCFQGKISNNLIILNLIRTKYILNEYVIHYICVYVLKTDFLPILVTDKILIPLKHTDDILTIKILSKTYYFKNVCKALHAWALEHVIIDLT